jgi:MFS family permease
MLAYSVFGTAPLYLNSLGAIIGSRVLVGVCEAAIMTCCTTLIGDYWSGARRARYLGLQTLLWQPAGHPPGHLTDRHLERVPWRQLLAPCLVTIEGGVIFYALIVQLSFVLTGVGITSTATIGGISAIMSLATALGSGSFAWLSRYRPRTLLPIAFGVSAVGLGVVFATTAVPVITVGAVLTGYGTGLLLPVLLTWAVNRLHFQQRGRGTGLWTGTLFVGQFTSPLIIAAIGAGAGGLQPALGVLAIVAAVLAVVTLIAVPRSAEPLNVTHG